MCYNIRMNIRMDFLLGKTRLKFFCMASLIAAALLFWACSTSKNKMEVTMTPLNDRWKTETGRDGKNAVVSFEANATTGFSWTYALSEKGIVREVSQEYVTEPHDEKMVGFGGRQFYVFGAVKEGRVRATFTYRRPWEGGETAGSVVLDLAVDSDGNVLFLEK